MKKNKNRGGVTVRNADRGAVKLEMGISPDGDNYDDDRYFRKAKKEKTDENTGEI